MSIKFRVLGGGFGGGGECRFYFYGRADFSDFVHCQIKGINEKAKITRLQSAHIDIIEE